MSITRTTRITIIKGKSIMGALVVLFSLVITASLKSQQVPVSDQGLFYYVIIERDNGRITSQGQMDIGGIDRLILPPETVFTMYALYSENLGVATTEFTSPSNGQTSTIPSLLYYDIEDFDTDEDGLSDLREFIVGTNIFNPDTDADGINDGAEIIQGLNALDGFIVETGIVGSGVVQGANTICISNNLAILGQANAGITVFNVTDSANPVRVADVPVPGTILDVACSGKLIAVAAGTEGLAVIDITDPPSATVIRTLRLGAGVQSVIMNGDQAYAGLSNGTIVWVDVRSGIELLRIKPSTSAVSDLGLGRSVLYAVAGNQLFTVNIRLGQFQLVNTLDLQGSPPVNSTSRRLFVGDTFLLLNHNRGFFSISIQDPQTPTIGQFNDLNQFGWKWIAANGSGLMMAAVSANSTLDGIHNVELYSIGQDGTQATQLQVFETEGVARSVAIYNGLAYVTDWRSGQQNGNLLVVNYLPYDSAGIPPSITLLTDAVENTFEEGKTMTATAQVGDDVQVRNVKFYIDGQLKLVDGNFPFEYRFTTPLITNTKDQFSITAIATDTGGNIATAEEIIILLTPDGTPPYVVNIVPRDNAIVGNVETIAITFSEVISPESLLGTPPPGSPPGTLSNPGIRVFREGDDGVLNTADDVRLDGALTFDEDTRTAYFVLAEPAIEGFHLTRVLPTIKDLAGNSMEEEFTARFVQAGFDDSDMDGLPDNVEIILGMDPFNPDSDGDSILDGMEDNDSDGLVNTAEILYGTDPLLPDSDGDTIKDGDEDFDADGLVNKDEFAAGTNPNDPDSDNDGYDDAGELLEGSDPADPNSRPLLRVSSDSASYLNKNSYGLPGSVPFFVQSTTTSFLNDSTSTLPQGTDVFVSSQRTSFRNGTSGVLPPGTPVTVAAGVVSYENN